MFTLLVQNLLNAKNVISVYGFTGNPGDDGYLESALGQQALENQVNPESFETMYNIKVNNPDNYAQPRRIHLGAAINF
jgi:hypothetical protein